MQSSFHTPRWLLHFSWIGRAWHGGRIGELRAFEKPLAKIDPDTAQPEQKWTVGFNVIERGAELHISLAQSFSREETRHGDRKAMSAGERFRLVLDLLGCAHALGFPEVRWTDWQPGGRKRPARLATRPFYDFRDAPSPLGQGVGAATQPDPTSTANHTVHPYECQNGNPRSHRRRT